MKRFAFFMMILGCVVTLQLSSCSDDDDNSDVKIPASELPDAAREFVAQYYGDVTMTSIEKEVDHGIIEYDVVLANGHEISFNADGEWIDVDAPAGMTVPAGIVPDAIAAYVADNFIGLGVNEISKNAAYYEVELTNGLDLIFDHDGNFVRQDRAA